MIASVNWELVHFVYRKYCLEGPQTFWSPVECTFLLKWIDDEENDTSTSTLFSLITIWSYTCYDILLRVSTFLPK